MKIFRKMLITVLTLTVMLSALCLNALAAQNTAKITVRIEGVSENLCYDDFNIPYSDSLTVEDALKYVDEECDTVTIDIESGSYGSYLNSVNGISAGNIAPLYYDGWQYFVNGVSAIEGISSCKLKDGDTLLVFYSDMFGESGFQIPIMDSSKIGDGVLTFTSKDVTYDVSGNAVETVNPIKDATVYFENNGKNSTYKTDSNGQIKINNTDLTNGSHRVQIEKLSKTIKVANDYIPLVLRFSLDTAVTVTNNNIIDNKPNNLSNSTAKNEDINEDKSPVTGYDYSIIIFALMISVSVMAISLKKITKSDL